MKIEKLRNNHKKEIIIGTVLTVVIGGALTFKLTHSKYRVTQSIDLGSGVINYTVPDFKIMAIKISEDGNTYNDSNAIPTGNFAINEEKTYCQTSSGNEVKGRIKTINGNHVITSLEKGDKCYLYFDKVTIGDILLANLGTNIKTETPDFSKISTTDDGVYQTIDGMYGGTTYYWRGAVANNYVKFAGHCWRIIRINGDKTVRLIYDGSTCHTNGTKTEESLAVIGVAYNSRYYQSNYVGWTYDGSSQRTLAGTDSNAKLLIENWYNNNIEKSTAKVADGKFCNDRDAAGTWSINTTYSFNYAVRGRLPNSPTFSCPSGDVYTLKVGLITADEVEFAGGVYGINNTSYYLYNGQNYWTMSPYSWNGTYARMHFVNSDGYLADNNVNYSAPNIRPVINLKSDVTFSSGDGSQNSPYTVS